MPRHALSPSPWPACWLALALVPALAFGHAERATYFVDPAKGERPALRSTGPARIVCKPDSRRLIRKSWAGRSGKNTRERKRLTKLMKRCRYRHIQQAVDAAKSGDRIVIMPGVYREEPSRKIPVKDPKCAGDEYWEASGDNHTEDGRVPTYKHQVDCPNARNLIAVIGDSTGRRGPRVRPEVQPADAGHGPPRPRRRGSRATGSSRT